MINNHTMIDRPIPTVMPVAGARARALQSFSGMSGTTASAGEMIFSGHHDNSRDILILGHHQIAYVMVSKDNIEATSHRE